MGSITHPALPLGSRGREDSQAAPHSLLLSNIVLAAAAGALSVEGRPTGSHVHCPPRPEHQLMVSYRMDNLTQCSLPLCSFSARLLIN